MMLGQYFGRLKRYPASVVGHVVWGAMAGYVGGVEGATLFAGGLAYQFGSGWRKAAGEGIDTVGMDSFDYALGYAVGHFARPFVVIPGVTL